MVDVLLVYDRIYFAYVAGNDQRKVVSEMIIIHLLNIFICDGNYQLFFLFYF